MKYRAALFGILAVTLAMILTLTVPAGDVSAADGECTAYINGADVSSYDTPGNAFEVDSDDDVNVSVNAPVPFASHKIDMTFTDIVSWTVSEETDDGTETSYATTVKVSDYAWLGAGIYKVTAKGVLVNGDTCSTVAYIKITGESPFSTLIGIIAIILVSLGVLGFMAIIIATWIAGHSLLIGGGCMSWFFPTIPLATVLTMVTMVTGGAGAPSPGAGEKTGGEDMTQVPSASQGTSEGGIRFRPRISILAIGSALLSAIGFVLLFQQTGQVYPTTTVVVLALVLALIAGIILPTIAMTFSRRRK